MFAGLGFLFGMYGADTAMTNAWWKRLLVLGFGMANIDSFKYLIDKAGDVVNSPEAKKAYDQARQ